jgi:hypothetical protein
MNVEVGAEAALFPEKEYIKGIFVAVCTLICNWYDSAIVIELNVPMTKILLAERNYIAVN